MVGQLPEKDYKANNEFKIIQSRRKKQGMKVPFSGREKYLGFVSIDLLFLELMFLESSFLLLFGQKDRPA
ncbi:MAG: hypothetical protein QME75_03800 [Deltaproteobacteria bacterium]|nr:hypothetical protein [Deltaproteobacteria bacterium]